ncbi:MAG: glycosyltransferase family 2 protein [Terracidiphilus sp.]
MIFSIVTPTYNRRDLLCRLFDSLVAQDYQGIEWIVVDDGGTDGTEDAVRGFQISASFTIRYLRKQNGGKISACNAGLAVASGDLVSVIDDDDYFLPKVFDQIAQDFIAIRDNDDIAGLSYISVDPDGNVRGRRFPLDRKISDHIECRFNQGITGDKCEFTKPASLRAHNISYSEDAGSVGGDTVFLVRVAEHYKTMYRNTPVLVKIFLPGGITMNRRARSLQCPIGIAEYYKAYLGRRVRVRIRLKYLVAYIAVLCLMRARINDSIVRSPWNRLLSPLAYLPGMLVGIRWRILMNRSAASAAGL